VGSVNQRGDRPGRGGTERVKGRSKRRNPLSKLLPWGKMCARKKKRSEMVGERGEVKGLTEEESPNTIGLTKRSLARSGRGLIGCRGKCRTGRLEKKKVDLVKIPYPRDRPMEPMGKKRRCEGGL